jgi:hypothetical protein
LLRLSSAIKRNISLGKPVKASGTAMGFVALRVISHMVLAASGRHRHLVRPSVGGPHLRDAAGSAAPVQTGFPEALFQ